MAKWVVGGVANLNEVYEGRVCDTLDEAIEHRDWLMNVEMYRKEWTFIAEIKIGN